MHPVEAQSRFYTKLTAALRQARNEGPNELGKKMLGRAAGMMDSPQFLEMPERDQSELLEFYAILLEFYAIADAEVTGVIA